VRRDHTDEHGLFVIETKFFSSLVHHPSETVLGCSVFDLCEHLILKIGERLTGLVMYLFSSWAPPLKRLREICKDGIPINEVLPGLQFHHKRFAGSK